MMAMVNMNNLLNGKDSRWLQLEVCREFQRNKCTRPDTECKFAHPPANVEVQNGRVTACYDSIKGRCNREKPPCKYFHPPQHLKDQLLINGRNHLALKNALMQQMGLSPGQPLVPGQVPAVAANPYLTGVPQVGSTYSPYFAPGQLVPAIVGPDPSGVASSLGVVPQTVVAQQKLPRSDRLEVCREFQRGACKRAESECRFAHPADSVTANEDGTVTVCMDAVKGRCNRDPCRYFHPPLHLQAQIKAAQSRASAMDMKSVGSFYYENFAFPGMMPYKRPAADKSGVPVYQPSATTYQQLMQLQQPFVPVSCEYTVPPTQPPVTSSASPAATAETQLVPSTPQITELEDDEPLPPACTSATISSHALADPATVAKEVAQQNYAKAVKLAAANQTLTNHLNPLNYTGVALNKQAVGMSSAAAAAAAAAAAVPRYQPIPIALGHSNLNIGLNPYSTYAHTNLINLARPPPVISPYSLMRAQYPVTTTAQMLAPNMIGAQYAAVPAAAPITSVPPPAHIAAAAAQNNNNTVMQPYKKLKTS